jgi:hypothetical protein
MSKSNKLQNIKAIRQMIDGTHAFQNKKTVGFSDAKDAAKKLERHEIGDTWEETDHQGNVWILEQREGFRVRKTKNAEIFQEIRDELRAFPKCRKETCTCLAPKPLDEAMRKANGMCFDCTIEMEHELRKEGKFEEYQKNRIRENALAWLRNAEQDVEMLKQTYTQATDFILNSEGEKETYAARMTSEEFTEKVEAEFAKFKENFLLRLEKGLQDENN